jgi:hypothetical protein
MTLTGFRQDFNIHHQGRWRRWPVGEDIHVELDPRGAAPPAADALAAGMRPEDVKIRASTLDYFGAGRAPAR